MAILSNGRGSKTLNLCKICFFAREILDKGGIFGGGKLGVVIIVLCHAVIFLTFFHTAVFLTFFSYSRISYLFSYSRISYLFSCSPISYLFHEYHHHFLILFSLHPWTLSIYISHSLYSSSVCLSLFLSISISGCHCRLVCLLSFHSILSVFIPPPLFFLPPFLQN